jgi:hypothetical protein
MKARLSMWHLACPLPTRVLGLCRGLLSESSFGYLNQSKTLATKGVKNSNIEAREFIMRYLGGVLGAGVFVRVTA